MSATHSPTESSLDRNRIAIGHPQVRHPVQRRASDKQLRGLPFKATRTDPFAKDCFHSKDLRLGQRAAMVARLALPLSPSFAPDGSQVLITDVPLSFRVAMLPDARPLLWRDGRSRFSLSDRVIAVAAIIRAIGRDLAQLILNLFQQVRKYLRVFETIGRDDYGHKLKGGLAYPNMEFAPGAAATPSVLAHFPFAFAVDFDAGGVHHQVQRLGLAEARQHNFQRAATTAKRRVTGHAQLHAEQFDERAGQPFGGAQGQAVHLFQSRHAEDGRIGIVSRLAAFACACRVTPRRKHRLVNPEGQTSTPDQSFVILTPVAETVRAFGFLLFHTKRLPALLSP